MTFIAVFVLEDFDPLRFVALVLDISGLPDLQADANSK
jgi:hypothetical protein